MQTFRISCYTSTYKSQLMLKYHEFLELGFIIIGSQTKFVVNLLQRISLFIQHVIVQLNHSGNAFFVFLEQTTYIRS